MLKKLIAIALSVMLAALPIFSVNVLADDAGALYLEAPLDGFGKSETATVYTSSSPYEKGGFKAPTTSAYDTTLVEEGDKSYMHMEVKSTQSPNGGAIIYDEDILIASDASATAMSLDYSITFRNSVDKPPLYIYFVNASGARIETSNSYLMRVWGQSGKSPYSYACKSYIGGNDGVIKLEPDVWYTFDMSMDFTDKTVNYRVDGGSYEDYKWSGAMSSEFLTACQTIQNTFGGISGVGIGYLGSVSAGSALDIADVSFKPGNKHEYFEELTFDKPSIATAVSTYANWSNGSWVSDFSSFSGVVALEDMGAGHSKALKYTKNDGQLATTLNLPSGTVGSNDTVVIELSYKSHSNGQPRMCLHGTGKRWYKLMNYNGTQSDTAILFGNSGNTATTPIDGQWRRIQFVLDLKNDSMIFRQWAENSPESVDMVVDSTGELASFTDVTSVIFYPYQKTWNNENYKMYLDDYTVYKTAPLCYLGTTPKDGTTGGVSLADMLTAEFNMPLADSALTNVTMTLTDSQGNTISGANTFNAKRTGIAFKPDYVLNLEETYTLTIGGTVYDIFGQSLSLDKTITFTTDELFDFKGCTFKQDSLEVASSGEIVGGKALTADVDIAINGGTPIGVAVALALYEKDSGCYVASDVVYTDDKTTIDHTLSVNVPDDGYKYYPAVYVWDSLDNPAAFIEAIVLE